MTGVTVKPWSGILMLRNTSSLETYFQAAFRVQSPWTIKDEENPNRDIIRKDKCYIFDFAPNRALKLISNYCSKNQKDNSDPEKQVEELADQLVARSDELGTGIQVILIEEIAAQKRAYQDLRAAYIDLQNKNK